MTAHSTHSKWKPGDETPEGFVEEIIYCVDMNMKIQSSAFAVMSHADALVHNCEMACYCEQRGEEFDWGLKDAPAHVAEIVDEIMSALRDKGWCVRKEKSAGA